MGLISQASRGYHSGNSSTGPSVHVISRKRLNDFVARHADAAVGLDVWYRVMKAKRYRSAHQLREDFPTMDVLRDVRTVFNIRAYRLIVDMRYDLGRVYIREVLTHDEYDRRSKAGTL
jgi:mRNA interferase HigB